MDSTAGEFDVFISYRRDGGDILSRLVKSELDEHGLSVFLDVEELKTGRFDDRLLEVIRNTPNTVILLSPGALDSCQMSTDWLRREIAAAIKYGKNIIPVIMPGFTFPEAETLPEDIREIVMTNAVHYVHVFADAAIEQIRDRLVVSESETRMSRHEVSLAGDLASEAFTFDALFPSWITVLVFRVWPAAMLMQWFIMLAITVATGTAIRVDVPAEFGSAAELRMRPLVSDYFFQSWNLLPFVLLALALRVRKRIRSHIANIYALDSSQKKEEKWKAISDRNNCWASAIASRWTLAGALLFATWVCVFQWNKLDGLSATGHLYWWDWRVSHTAYVVRSVALFIDWIGLIYLFGFVGALVHVLSIILRTVELRIDLGHGDSVNGLRVVGETARLFASFFIVASYCANAALLDHRGQNSDHVVMDYFWIIVGAATYFGAYVYCLAPAVVQARKHCRRESFRVRENRTRLHQRLSELLDGGLNSTKAIQEFKNIQAAVLLLTDAERVNTNRYCWPLPIQSVIWIAIVGTVPLALPFLLEWPQ